MVISRCDDGTKLYILKHNGFMYRLIYKIAPMGMLRYARIGRDIVTEVRIPKIRLFLDEQDTL